MKHPKLDLILGGIAIIVAALIDSALVALLLNLALRLHLSILQGFWLIAVAGILIRGGLLLPRIIAPPKAVQRVEAIEENSLQGRLTRAVKNSKLK